MKRAYLHWIVLLLVISFLEESKSGPVSGTRDEEKEYDIKKIPLTLLKDADAVIRTRVIRFEVKNKRRAYERVKFAVTIFKKEKRDYGYIKLHYNKFNELEELEGKIFNASGEEVRELDSKEIKDRSAFSDYSLYNDSRVRIAEMYHDQYPYTIEYIYEYSYDGYLDWPTWRSQETRDAVEQSRFEVVLPKEDSLRYWCNFDTVKPGITMEGNKCLYVWKSGNLPKLSRDVVGEDVEDVATIVRIAPSLFEYGGYPGDMRTWKEFGKWDYSLTLGRDILPESAVQDIHKLINPADNPREKVKKIYRYIQDRTRYVSIDLGIGGWQPFDATYVHERGYGDCKALVNYMLALLKEAGITGYAVDILPGDHRFPLIQEFPSAHFTHVIACVPIETDTIWLECTSRSMPFGHISCRNENRGALLLAPQGGILVYTPRTSSKQNKQQHWAAVELTSSGHANADILMTNSGNQQDYLRNALDEANPEDRERWILNHLGIPNVNLKNQRIDGLETRELEISVTLQIELPKYASVSRNRFFFIPNLMERETYIPANITQRLSPIRYNFPFLDTDSILYSLPSGVTPESIPDEVHIKTSFGSFNSKTVALGDTAVFYTRSLEIMDYSIPPDRYAEYRQFYSDIVKADRGQVVLVIKK